MKRLTELVLFVVLTFVLLSCAARPMPDDDRGLPESADDQTQTMQAEPVELKGDLLPSEDDRNQVGD